MATLAADTPRIYEYDGQPLYNHLPVIASDIIYEGAAVGDNASGYARPLVAQDPFLGFAEENVDNSAGAAGAKVVKVRRQGTVKLAVVGAASVADQGEPVYASDDNVFTLTSTSNTAVGKVARWITGTTCMVRYESVDTRSL